MQTGRAGQAFLVRLHDKARLVTVCYRKLHHASAGATDTSSIPLFRRNLVQTSRYAKPQVAVHWLADLPNTAEKTGSLRIHMILGSLTGLLVITRIAMGWRLPAPRAFPGAALARAGHIALKLLILSMAASGMVLALPLRRVTR
jgi:hypothetical protein